MVKTKAEGQQVLVGIKEDLSKWLLEKDKEGVLIPALVEPMDATIYVYARAGNDEEEQVDRNRPGGEGIGPQAAGSDARGGTDEGYPDSDRDNNNLDSDSSFNSSSSKTTFSDSETDTPCLSLIFSTPFLTSSKPIPPSPPYLAFTIAELYGPLPQPTPSGINSNNEPPPPVSTIPSGLLGVIPPAVRPHAHNMITITFDYLAESVLDSSKKLRMERAMLRAVKMVDGEWRKVWESVRKEKIRG